MSDLTWTHRFRSWLAGKLFLLAGKLDESYDVWLDDAPRRGAVVTSRWAATNTLRDARLAVPSDLRAEYLAALALVEAALDAAERVQDWRDPTSPHGVEQLRKAHDDLYAALCAAKGKA